MIELRQLERAVAIGRALDAYSTGIIEDADEKGVIVATYRITERKHLAVTLAVGGLPLDANIVEPEGGTEP